MSTVSVPLSPDLENTIGFFVKSGFASTKAEVMRKALTRLAEERAVADVLDSQREVREGKILSGDLRKLMKSLTV